MNILNLTPAAPDVCKQTEQLFCRTRTELLVKHPLSGSMALRLEPVFTDDKRMPTSCTDGTYLAIDVSFFKRLSPAERMILIAHNVGTAHFATPNGRKPGKTSLSTTRRTWKSISSCRKTVFPSPYFHTSANGNRSRLNRYANGFRRKSNAASPGIFISGKNRTSPEPLPISPSPNLKPKRKIRKTKTEKILRNRRIPEKRNRKTRQRRKNH